MISFVGVLLGNMFNLLNVTFNLKSLMNYKFVLMFGSMWSMPFLSTQSISEVNLINEIVSEKFMDKDWYEYFGGQGLYYLFTMLFGILNMLQMNSIKVFMKMFVLGMVITLFTFM